MPPHPRDPNEIRLHRRVQSEWARIFADERHCTAPMLTVAHRVGISPVMVGEIIDYPFDPAEEPRMSPADLVIADVSETVAVLPDDTINPILAIYAISGVPLEVIAETLATFHPCPECGVLEPPDDFVERASVWAAAEAHMGYGKTGRDLVVDVAADVELPEAFVHAVIYASECFPSWSDLSGESSK